MPFEKGRSAFNTGKYVADKSNDNPDEDKTDLRLKESRENDIIDAKYGFNRVADNLERVRRLTGRFSE